MHLIERSQPDVAVYAAAAIPTGVGLLGIVNANGYSVFTVRIEIRSEIVAERSIAIGAGAEFMTIDEDCGVHIGSIEVNVYFIFGLVGRESESLAVPAYSAGESSASGT